MRERSPQCKRYLNLFRNLSNPYLYILLKLGILKKQKPIIFKMPHGIRAKIPPHAQLTEFKTILMDDCYFKGFHRPLFEENQEITILDVGSNLGYFSLYAMSKFPNAKILCIEPLPQNYEHLTANLEMNKNHQFMPLNVALSDKRGELVLYSMSNEKFPTDATAIPTGTGHQKCYKVPALSLAELLDNQSIPEIHFLKSDCEGAEYQMLYSCSKEILERVHNIAMEVHAGKGHKENIQSMQKFLCSYGFACCIDDLQNFLWASRDADNLVEHTS